MYNVNMNMYWIDNINKLLKDIGKPKKYLSKILDVGESTANHYLNGRRQLDIPQLIKIAEYFKVSVAEIILPPGEFNTLQTSMEKINNTQRQLSLH